MDSILLTYTHIDGYSTYGWFESIEEINEFVMTSGKVGSLNECIDCSNVREIDLSELGD